MVCGGRGEAAGHRPSTGLRAGDLLLELRRRVTVFALGAGVSFYQGASQLTHPTPIRHATVNYVVLALSAVFEGTTWLYALGSFKGSMRAGAIPAAIRESKDPPSFMVLFEDGAALIGLGAVLGTSLSVRLDPPSLDGSLRS